MVVVVVCLNCDGREREFWVWETVLVVQDAAVTNPGSCVELGKQTITKER